MRKGLLFSIFWGLLLFWGYRYPYQWWLKYGHTEATAKDLTNNYLKSETESALPKPFKGTDLLATPSPAPKVPAPPAQPTAAIGGVDVAGPVLDEIKVCFGDGPVAAIPSANGDLSMLLLSMQNQLGPVQEDLLIEKRVEVRMPGGSVRTLVYEWISAEEGTDVYWHETDAEGFPRPLDLPDGSGRDLATFERLRRLGTSARLNETNLIQLQNGLQLGVEKTDGAVQSLSLKDEGHLIKCRRDPVKSFVCDCLN
jgi:hypothetical protein